MNFKNFGFWDIGLTKWSVFFMTLFLVSVWEQFAYWVMNTHWSIFLVLSLFLAIKPILAVFKK